jgi:hypothetical protein
VLLSDAQLRRQSGSMTHREEEEEEEEAQPVKEARDVLQ